MIGPRKDYQGIPPGCRYKIDVSGGSGFRNYSSSGGEGRRASRRGGTLTIFLLKRKSSKQQEGGENELKEAFT